jgi:hypothetical protein
MGTGAAPAAGPRSGAVDVRVRIKRPLKRGAAACDGGGAGGAASGGSGADAAAAAEAPGEQESIALRRRDRWRPRASARSGPEARRRAVRCTRTVPGPEELGGSSTDL